MKNRRKSEEMGPFYELNKLKRKAVIMQFEEIICLILTIPDNWKH